jgi:DNA-binding XRE family transcriptional regulator
MNDNYIINWHQVVSFIRGELFYSQKELGEIIGVSQQTIQQWQKQAYRPSPDKQEVLTKMLRDAGVSLKFFKPITDASLQELIDIYKKSPIETQTELMEFARTMELEFWYPII